MARRHDRTGRSTFGERFVALPHDVIESPGFRRSSPAARAVLIEVARLYNGRNNGSIGVSIRDAAAWCGIGKSTAARALQDLEDSGLIERTAVGSFRDHLRIASTFRITWRRCDVTGAQACRKYRC